MGLLGCPEGYTVIIASKNGVVLGSLDVSTVNWTRVVDDISDATITIPIKDAECCDIIGQIHTWHHEAQLYRDGDYVWSGPITDITGGRFSAVLICKDIGEVVANRIIHDELDFTVPADLTVIGTAIINNALIVDGHHYVIESQPTGIFGQRVYQPGESAWADVQEALGLGLDMTVLGRKIILGASNGGLPFGVTQTLVCDDFVGDLNTEEDGMSLATRVITVGNGFIGIAVAPGADANGVHPYYGLIEYVDTSQPNLSTQDQADAAAARILQARFPAPQILVVPAGSQLAPTAPISINELVPGAWTTIVADCLCRPLTATLVLLKVEVNWSSAGETVGVTYGSLYSINSGTSA